MSDRPRYFARSASDRTNDWPRWFVADRSKGGMNVTADLIREYRNPDHCGGVFLPRIAAEALAAEANGASHDPH
ncbi:hypothetical protein SAMN04489859_102057 [Paracoccus alcaliphilus]|uniref:Uncharacterized protein n=1 Tax=Paracoccus alcaliphilus TaxID=34002 RepID=A0A1H8K636_9RHOB|nr:hypothetical protein [Paracoccus alcaliphilus]WCR17552.1 hypothetical protein JHW40_14625 [Paracoccus alcaliphilus]SEN87926.1 hypothetical protein SAMN04489859_102057 [Paracoccus alcaliphilus]